MMTGGHTRVTPPLSTASASSSTQKHLGSYFAVKDPYPCLSGCGGRMATDAPLCSTCSPDPSRWQLAGALTARRLRQAERQCWAVEAARTRCQRSATSSVPLLCDNWLFVRARAVRELEDATAAALRLRDKVCDSDVVTVTRSGGLGGNGGSGSGGCVCSHGRGVDCGRCAVIRSALQRGRRVWVDFDEDGAVVRRREVGADSESQQLLAGGCVAGRHGRSGDLERAGALVDDVVAVVDDGSRSRPDAVGEDDGSDDVVVVLESPPRRDKRQRVSAGVAQGDSRAGELDGLVACPACTFLNTCIAPECGMCGMALPVCLE